MLNPEGKRSQARNDWLPSGISDVSRRLRGPRCAVNRFASPTLPHCRDLAIRCSIGAGCRPIGSMDDNGRRRQPIMQASKVGVNHDCGDEQDQQRGSHDRSSRTDRQVGVDSDHSQLHDVHPEGAP